MKLSQIYRFALAILFVLCQTFVSAQCTIDACPSEATLVSGTPYFNGSGITIPAVKFNNIYCPTGFSAIDVYLYQLLPNGERMEQCNVFGDIPDNISANVQIYFGAPDICIDSLFVIDIDITEADGFSICDGAVYEVVLALWVDDVNSGTLISAMDTPTTVYNVFPNGNNINFIDYSAGIVSIEEEDSQDDYPLIVNDIYEWSTGQSNIQLQTCSDVEFYAAGFSLLANCSPFDNYNNGIGSEIYNTLSYSINGSPSNNLIFDSDGIGGPITGNCYGGILTDAASILETSNMGLVDDDELTITLTTTDFFTNESESSTLEIEFIECEIECLPANNVNVGSISANTASISWSSPINPDGFIVEIRLKYSNDWQVYNSSVNFILFSALLSCEEYEFRISNTCGGQIYTTSIKEFSTIGCPIPCQALEGLFINNPTNNSIVLAWDIYPNAFSYSLFYRMQGATLWLQDTSPLPLAILFNLAQCSNWEWYVVVNCNDGTHSPPSAIANFSTIGCFKDDGQVLFKDINLFPNPATEFIQFEIINDKIEWETVYISNSSGQVFNYWSINELTNNRIDIRNLEAGFYFLHFLSYEGISSEPFIVE